MAPHSRIILRLLLSLLVFLPAALVAVHRRGARDAARCFARAEVDQVVAEPATRQASGPGARGKSRSRRDESVTPADAVTSVHLSLPIAPERISRLDPDRAPTRQPGRREHRGRDRHRHGDRGQERDRRLDRKLPRHA